MNEKSLWLSKTFWVNIIAIIAIIIQYKFTGFVLTPEIQASILAVVNIILRLITKKEIIWTEKEKVQK